MVNRELGKDGGEGRRGNWIAKYSEWVSKDQLCQKKKKKAK